MTRRSKRIFQWTGVAIVAFWVVMLALLVKKVHFRDEPASAANELSPTPVDAAEREWKEIFVGERKVGFSVSLIKPFGGGYFIQDEIFLKLDLMGMGGGLYASTQAQVDEGFILKSFSLKMTSGIVRYKVAGRVENNALLIEGGKGEKSRTIKLGKPPMLAASMNRFFRSRRFEVGQSFRLPLFDPSTMAQKEAVIRVVAKEPVRIHKVKYDAFRLEVEMWGKPFAIWIDEEGKILKEEGPMGFTTVQSNAANAPSGFEGKGIDLYEIAAVRVDRTLRDPTRLVYLKLKLEGMSPESLKPEAWNSERQKILDGVAEIRSEKLPSRSPYLIPYDDAGGKMKRFLAPELNVESDDEEVRAKAGQISGKENEPAVVARKLMNWVYLHIDKKPVLSIPSALETLRTRVGDCNEHATLLAALLRASGIPARLCTGLVYTRGNFYYHAWTEAYLGEWISMDATMNQMPTDATHLKLVEGNLESQVAILGLMGTLKVEVIDFRHD